MELFNHLNEKPKKQYHCPYCGMTKIIDYGDTFECPHCHNEFEKADFEYYKDESILSINNIMMIISIMKELWGI